MTVAPARETALSAPQSSSFCARCTSHAAILAPAGGFLGDRDRDRGPRGRALAAGAWSGRRSLSAGILGGAPNSREAGAGGGGDALPSGERWRRARPRPPSPATGGRDLPLRGGPAPRDAAGPTQAPGKPRPGGNRAGRTPTLHNAPGPLCLVRAETQGPEGSGQAECAKVKEALECGGRGLEVTFGATL